MRPGKQKKASPSGGSCRRRGWMRGNDLPLIRRKVKYTSVPSGGEGEQKNIFPRRGKDMKGAPLTGSKQQSQNEQAMRGLRATDSFRAVSPKMKIHRQSRWIFIGSPTGTRTPVFAVRGRRLNRLTMRPCPNLLDYYIIKKQGRQAFLRGFFRKEKDPPVPQYEKVLTRFSQVGAPLAASAFPFKNRPRLSA